MKSLAQVLKNIFQKLADHSYVDKKLAQLVDGAPEQLDTLKELSSALNNDKDFAATITKALANKLDKTGKATSASSADSVAWANVSGKPSSFAPSSHNQDWSTITNKPAQATRWPSWTEVTSKPSSFAPSAHNQDWSTITGKPTTFAPSAHNQGWSTITGKPTLIGIESFDASTGTLKLKSL